MTAKQKESDSIPYLSGKLFRVFIIHENIQLGQKISKKLENAGFSVLLFHSGKEALKEITGNYHDILLLDVSLPDMSGKQLVENLLAHKINIPFFITVDHPSDLKKAQDLMNLGAKDFIITERGYLDTLPLKLDQICKSLINARELEESEKFLKDTIDSMQDGFSILDDNGMHLMVNPAFTKMTGYSNKELIGKKPPHPYWPEEEYETIMEAFNSTLKGTFSSFELIFKKKNGEQFPVIVSPSQIKDGEGKVVSNFTTVKDISKLKQAETDLKASRDLLTATGKMAKVGGWELDTKTMKLSWTEETFNIHELPIDYKPPLLEALSFFHPKDRPRIEKALKLAINEGKPYDLELQLITAKGKHLITHTICNPIIKNSKVVKLVGTFQDITERKKIENELEQHQKKLELLVQERTNKLQIANIELEEFVYSVSHDLRAPLRSIMGFSEIIERRHRKSLNEEGLEYFNFIKEASNNMSDLINDLLRYSRLGKWNYEDFNPGDVIMDVKKSVQTQNKDARVNITFPEKLAEIKGSRTLLKQIVYNLVENGIKYHKPDVPPEISISVTQQAKHLVLTVADNGIGIDPKYHEKIFRMFQRLHSNEHYPGTGIGLAIVKKSVTMLNGTIHLDSELDKGSTFIVKIPEIKNIP